MKTESKCLALERSLLILACLGTITLFFAIGCSAKSPSSTPVIPTTSSPPPVSSPIPTPVVPVAVVPSPTPTIAPSPTPMAVPSPTPTPVPSPSLPYTTITPKDKAGNVIVGADRQPIVLNNYADAKNQTYQALLTFLKSDKTDEILYDRVKFGRNDYAEAVHNNAEKAGIRCALVDILLKTDSGSYILILNAFETTDRGIVYIDCTGKEPVDKSAPTYTNSDTKVDMEVGFNYARVGLFPQPGWNPIYPSYGTIAAIGLIQW